jgi:hypothetical protein
MFNLLKFLIFVAFIVLFVWFGSTVKLGKHTLFGHVQRIWTSEETQDLVEGAKDSAGPTVDKVKRGVKAGIKEIKKEPDGGLAPDTGE